MGEPTHKLITEAACAETLLMHSKCVRKFLQKELSLAVSCIEKFAKSLIHLTVFVNIMGHDGNAIFA